MLILKGDVCFEYMRLSNLTSCRCKHQAHAINECDEYGDVVANH